MKKEFYGCIFFIAVACLLGCSAPKAQVQSKGTVKREYDVIYNQLPSRLQNAYGEGDNIAIARAEDINADTLNLEDKIPSDVKITDATTGSSTVRQTNSGNELGYIPIYRCMGVQKRDTLILTLTDAFHSSVIKHYILGRSVMSTYQQFENQRAILKTALNSQPVDSIQVPATAKIQVYRAKSNPYVVYCKVDLTTQPFYVADTFFKDGYLKKRVRMKYYLKATLKN